MCQISVNVWPLLYACHSYILTALLTIRAGPDPRLYLNSTHEFDKVRAMKSVAIDLVTSPAHSSGESDCMLLLVASTSDSS